LHYFNALSPKEYGYATDHECALSYDLSRSPSQYAHLLTVIAHTDDFTPHPISQKVKQVVTLMPYSVSINIPISKSISISK